MIHWVDKIFLVRLHHREITINLLTEQNYWLVTYSGKYSLLSPQFQSTVKNQLPIEKFNRAFAKWLYRLHQTTKSTRRTIYVYGAQRFPHLSSHPRLRMLKSFNIEASLILTLTWRKRRARAWWCTRRTPGTCSGRMFLCCKPGLNN